MAPRSTAASSSNLTSAPTASPGGPIVSAPASASKSRSAKRSRKRRRRQVSYSPTSSDDDSDDDDDDDEDEDEGERPKVAGKQGGADAKGESMEVDEESDESSESSSDSEESEESEEESEDSEDSEDSDDSDDSDSRPTSKPILISASVPSTSRPTRTRAPTLSPSPPPRQVPSFLAAAEPLSTSDRRDAFRRVYMDKLVQGFGGDLEKLRASDPNLGLSRLQLLIDSLASGIDVFSDPVNPTADGADEVDEVGVMLNGSS